MMVPALMVVSIALSCLVNPSYNFVYRMLSAEANAATVIFVTSDTYGGSEYMSTWVRGVLGKCVYQRLWL